MDFQSAAVISCHSRSLIVVCTLQNERNEQKPGAAGDDSLRPGCAGESEPLLREYRREKDGFHL